MFCKKGVLRNFAKFTGKHLCQRLLFNKVAGRACKSLWHRCFPVNFAKLLRTPSFYRTPPVAACFHNNYFYSYSSLLIVAVKRKHQNFYKKGLLRYFASLFSIGFMFLAITTSCFLPLL